MTQPSHDSIAQWSQATMTPPLRQAVRAAQDRKALDLDVLDLNQVSSFTDFFLICSGTSTRHTQAICDAIVERLEKFGVSPGHIEGYAQAEWILLDYLSFVVHIFSQRARQFYDLERLWKNARRVPIVNGER
jgi:ribosome-associated protein